MIVAKVGRQTDAALAPTKISKTTPCTVAGAHCMDVLSETPTRFDTSGKSAALIHHLAICRTPVALPGNGLFGAIAGKRILTRN
jgi:hypothetical protein